ncbi:TonB-dependent receptor domain-containing protein [Chelativorans sp. J32]|uniref:TonB-dependent receptor domain-containing protein n=1 Tax=Chelativorans sp. J32 TaxID=935840 RepID=UPI0004BC8E72|nr:TonB-dependent receptor [Chelativorans sp. J32]
MTGRNIARTRDALVYRHIRSCGLNAAIFVIALTPAVAQAEETTRLERLVVTAAGFEQNVADAPASISVITREDLENGAFRDLTDALKEVQGVAVTGVANEKDIYIRGLPGAYTLILVDGKRQSTRDSRPNGSAGYEQSFVPPISAIERIEIVRGPMSSLYGSDAMGGVINIITRKVSDVWSGSVTVEGTLQQHARYGNSGQTSFYASGPVINDYLGLQVWGRGLLRDEDSFDGGVSEAREGDINGRLTFTPNENHDIYLEGGFTRARRLSHAGESIAANQSDSYRDHDRAHWSATHVGRWGQTTSEFSLQQEWGERTTYTHTPAQGRFVENPRSPEILNTVLDGKFTTPFAALGDHTLVTGGQVFHTHLTDQNPGRRTGVDEVFEATQWALFVEDEWRIHDRFSLTGGLRMDHHEAYGSHFSPRLYGVWHATDNLTIKGGVSTGFRAPEIRQIAPGYAYTTGGAGCSYGPNGTCGVIIGDPDLEAEKSTSYEIGVLWDSYAGLSAGATFFYTDFRDKIANALVVDANGVPVRWSEDPNYRLWYHYNVDDATIRGVELAATWEATPTLTFRGSYTYTDSEQKTGDYAGFPLARTPKHQASLRGDWMATQRLNLWANATYHGSEIAAGARIGTNGTPVTINGAPGRKYKPYMLVDIGASFDFNDSVTLKGAVYNLFDKKIEATDFNTEVEGRRLWVGLTTTF